MTIKTTPSFRYQFYGQSFRSNVPLPGAHLAQPYPKQKEIALYLGVPPSLSSGPNPQIHETLIYASAETDAVGNPALRILKLEKEAFVRVSYSDGMQFWIDGSLENIWAAWPKTSSLESTLPILLGPVLGLLLRLRGVTCLHASAVAFGNCAVAFLGASGSGKSTTAAAFARQGCAILSDDIAALSELDGSFQVMPGYPRVCLWPNSVEMLYGTADALPRIDSEDAKRFLALDGKGGLHETRALPLAAIYVLGERRLEAPPVIEPLRGQSALLSLVADTFANKVLDRQIRAQEFEVLSRLVEKVSVRRLYAHQDPSRIAELCRLIRDDFTAIRRST